MITGDNKATAEAIACDVGIFEPNEDVSRKSFLGSSSFSSSLFGSSPFIIVTFPSAISFAANVTGDSSLTSVFGASPSAICLALFEVAITNSYLLVDFFNNSATVGFTIIIIRLL